MKSISLQIASSYEAARLADQALEELLGGEEVPQLFIQESALALHELLNNLIEHAYDGAETGSIGIEMTFDLGKLVLVTTDTGKTNRMDLNQIEMPDPTDLAEGGYGLAIIQALVDSIDYQLQDGKIPGDWNGKFPRGNCSMALLVNMTDYLIKIVALELSGRLDVFEVPVLRKACDDLIEQGIVHLVFDLNRVEIIDSSGLAVLVGALKRTRMLNGDVRLIWPRAEAAARVLS